MANTLTSLAFGAALTLVSATVLAADRYDGVSQVEVFANSTMVITSTRSAPFPIKVYRVDGLAQAEALANQGLPQTEAEATVYLARQQEAIRRRVEPLIREALQGLQLVQRYRLDRMPAVVVNQQSVVFGVTDVDDALQRFQAHRVAKAVAAK